MNKLKAERLFFYATILISFLYHLRLSWCRWGTLTSDTFRDQWVFYRLSEGSILYKELFYLYGFLPAYTIALLNKLFGVHMNNAIVAGICITMASCVLIYRISRLFMNRVFSTLVTLNFIFVLAFGAYCYNGIFNFILPYSVASTFYIFFVFLAVYFFLRFIKMDDSKMLLFWAASIYLAFLSRPEMTLPVWAAFAFSGIFYKLKSKKTLYILAPFILAAVSYALFLYWNGAFEAFKESVIVFSGFVLGKKGGVAGGWEDIHTYLPAILRSLSLHFIAVSLFYTIAALLASLNKKGYRYNVAVLLGTSAIIGIAMFDYMGRFLPAFGQFRFVPMILIFVTLLYGARILFRGDVSRESYMKMTLFLISMVLILRIAGNVTPNRYGFFLLPLGLIAYYVFFIDMAPSFLARFFTFADAAKTKFYYSVSIFLLLGLLMVPYSIMNHWHYKVRNCSIVSARGEIRLFGDVITKYYAQALSHLDRTEVDSTLVVFPEGISMNFILGRDNPLKYDTFLPSNIEIIGEDIIIKDLAENEVDYVAIIYVDAFDYGYTLFGVDYGMKTRSWIEENYALEKTIGPGPFEMNRFGINIYARKR